MENKFPIWQTTKQSFTFVYYHFINWVRLASALFLIMLIAGILVLIMDGNQQAVTGMEMKAMGAGIGVFLVVFIANLVVFLMFAVNAYRYVMYNEGGNKWFEFRFDYMWRFSYILIYLAPNPHFCCWWRFGGVTAIVAMMDIT